MTVSIEVFITEGVGLEKNDYCKNSFTTTHTQHHAYCRRRPKFFKKHFDRRSQVEGTAAVPSGALSSADWALWGRTFLGRKPPLNGDGDHPSPRWRCYTGSRVLSPLAGDGP
jgi:hypothetical protein